MSSEGGGSYELNNKRDHAGNKFSHFLVIDHETNENQSNQSQVQE